MVDKELTFEEALARLSELAEGLESGKAPLGEGLSMFEDNCSVVSSSLQPHGL